MSDVIHEPGLSQSAPNRSIDVEVDAVQPPTVASLVELARDILADGKIDLKEVELLRERLYADSRIDHDEADLLFKLNDATNEMENHPAWKELFVEALTDYVMKSDGADGTIDESGAETLIQRIEEDGKLDANERALLNRLAHATLAPGHSRGGLDSTSPTGRRWHQFTDTASLFRALHIIIDFFQDASTKEQLCQNAVRGVMELVGLDFARVLEPSDEGWLDETPANDASIPLTDCLTYVFDSVKSQKRTIWGNVGQDLSKSQRASLAVAAVASPILNGEGQVTAVLYGVRRRTADSSRSEINGMDAMLVELLACGIASGLTRLSQEDTTRRLRLQFEQFFTKDLARRIEADRHLLDGREADVTVLFCDVRGFSTISEKLDAVLTFNWMNDVLTELSECVIHHSGVLIDYVGDELMAIWGAPDTQADHADRAVQAALDMLGCLEALNARWEPRLGRRFDLGIGINSGRVRAGNAGSERKFKYGVRGSAVNIASRVTGAAKFLNSQLLLTCSTFRTLSKTYPLRRIGSVRVVNIEEAVTLYGLDSQLAGANPAIVSAYESALDAFERQDFHEAASLLTDMLKTCRDDGPSLVLLNRAVEAMVHGASPQHPVWELPGK